MIFCYRTEDGVVHDVWMTSEEREKREKAGRIRLADGRLAQRDIVFEQKSRKATRCDLYPMKCPNLGVLPRQRKEAYEDSVKRGVPTEFDERGDPIFETRKHRKRYCEAYHVFDQDGGYSDPQRR